MPRHRKGPPRGGLSKKVIRDCHAWWFGRNLREPVKPRGVTAMHIVAPDFRIVLHIRAGVVAKADRAMRYLEGRSLGEVLALVERRGWKVEFFNDLERSELAAPKPGAGP